jgi:D-alanyl-lipoteichoic acid acyltransferase DltB (MBOAT superfamily)
VRRHRKTDLGRHEKSDKPFYGYEAMLFNSLTFAVFFLIVFIGYYIVAWRVRWIWLLVVSAIFYMWSRPALIIVPVLIALVGYVAGIQLDRCKNQRKKRLILLSSICIFVGTMVFYKYTNFFSNTIFSAVNIFKIKIFGSPAFYHNPFLITVLVPLGLSYITFQVMGYLIEIYRGNTRPEKHLGLFSAYLMFFPKVISGPIERAHHFLPQLKAEIKFDPYIVSQGLKLMLWGFIKKLVIADRLVIYVNDVFPNMHNHNGKTLLLASVFSTIQMYADFSGYTDIALGLSKMLGFDIIQNFNRPFFATTISEFWRKWHISLSTWFADYVYTPLAIANREWGVWSVVFSSMVTFIILGLWHGANWTFIVFGALQGIMLSIEFTTRKIRKKIGKKIPAIFTTGFGIVYVFSIFSLSLIFFRSDSVKDAIYIIAKILHFDGAFYIGMPSQMVFSIFGIVTLLLIESKMEFKLVPFSFLNNKRFAVRFFTYLILVLYVLLFSVFDGGQFVYFRF